MADPRTILSAAGVSLPDVEEYHRMQALDLLVYSPEADAALVAVSQELAKYKWVAEHDLRFRCHPGYVDTGEDMGDVVSRQNVAGLLLARYEEARHE